MGQWWPCKVEIVGPDPAKTIKKVPSVVVCHHGRESESLAGGLL